MRVLVTRPVDDAKAFAAALRQAGHDPVESPALTMTVETGGSLDLSPYQAIVITSANAVRALGARTGERHKLMVCVGPASADAARKEGFVNVGQSDGDGVAGLAQTVRERFSPSEGPLYYPSAREVAGNLQAELAKAGFAIVRDVVYRMDIAGRLSDQAEKALAEGRVDLVTYFSARSLEGTLNAAAGSGRQADLRRLSAVCLSQAVAQAAAVVHRQVAAASAPTDAAMVQAIDRLRVSGL